MSNNDVRVGVLVPVGNTIHEREFERIKPECVSFSFRGFTSPAGSPNFCLDLANGMAAPMKELTDWGAKLILIGCTTASMKCGSAEIHERLEKTAGVPVITAASAVRDAFRALPAATVSVATPYSDASNAVVTEFLAREGIQVSSIAGLGFDRSPDVWKANAPTLSADALLDFSLSIDTSAANAHFLPCTGINSLDALRLFEQRRGKPAVSSVQAGYWAAMRRLGVNGRRTDAGHLVARWDF